MPTTDSRARRADWNSVVKRLMQRGSQELWRAYCDALYSRLLDRWLPSHPAATALKTDLYDEAFADGLAPRLAQGAEHVFGLDVSLPVVLAARRRHAWLRSTLADVRALPFAPQSLELVLSNSTLDHFDDRADIELALDELAGAAQPGGYLVVTLDNPQNPIVWLRNTLPMSFLRRIGIVPYHVGATHGISGLRRLLDRSGFEVVETTAIMHCPRVVMIPVARMLRYGSPRTASRFLRFLGSWEYLERLPTRFFSGHYVAALAVRR